MEFTNEKATQGAREDEVVASVGTFLRDAESRGFEFFNEAELQHELGYWLRNKLPAGMFVYFERPAASFFPKARGLVKKVTHYLLELFSNSNMASPAA